MPVPLFQSWQIGLRPSSSRAPSTRPWPWMAQLCSSARPLGTPSLSSAGSRRASPSWAGTLGHPYRTRARSRSKLCGWVAAAPQVWWVLCAQVAALGVCLRQLCCLSVVFRINLSFLLCNSHQVVIHSLTFCRKGQGEKSKTSFRYFCENSLKKESVFMILCMLQ